MAEKKTTAADLGFMDKLWAAAAHAVRSDCGRQHEQ